MSEANKENMTKWYFKTSALVVALLCVGPLALPLLWFNPRFSPGKKVLISLAVLVLSYFLWVATKASLTTLADYYKQLS